MRKPIILLLILGSLLYIATQKPVIAATSPEAMPSEPDQLIRFHVLANSDTAEDQELKRKVRDAIVKEMAPEFRQAKSLSEAKTLAKANLPRMEELAAAQIRASGKLYPVRATFGTFQFPTKTYGKFTLPAGNYEAVRVVIGKGEGSNWWCVLFPPLCFIDLTHSLAANPALMVNNPTDGEGRLGEVNQTVEQGKIEIRFKILELWDKLTIKSSPPQE